MKKILLLLIVFPLIANCQVFATKAEKDLNKFKQTETIFILCDFYDTKVYEDILQKCWTVTPFKVVKRADFNPLNYMEEKYSFAYLNVGREIQTSAATYIFTKISFFFFDMKDKQRELEKYRKFSVEKKKEHDIMSDNRVIIGTIILYPMEKLLLQLFEDDDKEKNEILINTEESFINLKPGYLTNYFQKLNNVIITGEGLLFNENIYKPELKELKKQILYIPTHVTTFNRSTVEDKDGEGKEEIFQDYKYKYEVIDHTEIDKRILEGKEFYYLRFTRSMHVIYLDIVNSKTGEIVYSDADTSLTHRLRSTNVRYIMKAIEKGKAK